MHKPYPIRKAEPHLFWTTLPSPLGELTLSAENQAITGLWFPTSNKRPAFAPAAYCTQLPLFQEAQHWLEIYFSGKNPGETPPLSPNGSDFSQAVWALLRQIPYGKTCTYGMLSQALQAQGISASPQAVGGAVARNPISIFIPCHRVVGKNGSLTGYAAGLAAKHTLLNLEGITVSIHGLGRDFPSPPSPHTCTIPYYN